VSTQEPTAPPEEAPAVTEEDGPVSIAEVTDLSEDEFRNSIRSARGCVVEQEVPCDLYTSMSAELVEWRRGQWYPTGNIVSNRRRWGVRVRFTYYGNYEFCLAGRLKITAWWDGFSNLPEGHRDAYIIDPCRRPHQYEVVIPVTGLRCPDHAGVYDIAATLDFVCCDREAIVLGHCDLEAIRVTC
jgi:hypothetical protein